MKTYRYTLPLLAAFFVAMTTIVALGFRDAQNISAEAAGYAVDSLPSPAAPGSAQPNLAVDQNGRVYLSWLEPADTGHAMRFSTYDGARWSPARTIVARRDFFINWADFPSMQALDGGLLAAHWLQRTGSGTYAYGVRVAQSRDGGRTWSAPITPHTDSSPNEHGFVATWREEGQLGVVWLDGRKFKEGNTVPNEMTLMATTIAPDGSRGTEVLLDDRTCDCCQNAVAMAAQGPIVAYRDRSPEEIRDIYVTRRVGGVWTKGVAVHADNWKINACPVNGPSIAARNNLVAIAWFTGARDTARVKLAFSVNGGATFASPVIVDGGSPVGRVSVSLFEDGAALVTWLERASNGDAAVVLARRVTRDGRAGAPLTVTASSAARATGFPRAILTRDFALFAWTQAGRPSSVQVARVPIPAFR